MASGMHRDVWCDFVDRVSIISQMHLPWTRNGLSTSLANRKINYQLLRQDLQRLFGVSPTAILDWKFSCTRIPEVRDEYLAVFRLPSRCALHAAQN